MDQLKNFTGWGKGRFLSYLIVLFAGLGLALAARLGFGVYTELPDGGWTWTVTVTKAQLDLFTAALAAGGFSGVLAMLKGFKTRVGDIPTAERVGDKPLSSPPLPVTSPVVQ